MLELKDNGFEGQRAIWLPPQSGIAKCKKSAHSACLYYRHSGTIPLRSMLDPLSPLTATGTPFIFSRGNHETRGQFAREIGQYFNGYSDKFYFSFEHGPIYFIVLDSGEDKDDSDFTYAGLSAFDAYRIEQAKWLKEEVKKKAFKKAKYKVDYINRISHKRSL